MESLLLTIDIGTTAIKYDIHDEVNVLYSTKSRIKTNNFEDRATQNPEEILEQIKADITKLTGKYKSISEISFSVAMHTLIPISDSDEKEMLLWSDNRATQVITDFKKNELDKQRIFYEKTGTPIHAMSPFAKLLYFKEKDKEYFQKINFWSDIKSFILHYMTGEWCTDFSTASATGLFNSLTLEWDVEILNFLGLKVEQLPFLKHPKEKISLLKKVALELGLVNHVTVRLGASDGCLAALGSYDVTGSPKSITLGTSGAVRLLSSTRKLSANGSTFCYYLDDDKWVVGGPSNNGGRTLEWLSQLLYEDDSTIFSVLSNMKKDNKLVFLPYLQGERAPIWDSNERGSFYGLSLTNSKLEIIQAVVEGVLFNLYFIYNQINMAKDNDLIVLSGGVFQNKEIPQMLATIFNSPCFVSKQTEPSHGLKMWWSEKQDIKSEGLYYYPSKSENEIKYYEQKYRLFCQYLDTNN